MDDEMQAKKTTCFSYFAICNRGEIRPNIGFVAEENSGFDPEEFTRLLGIVPFASNRLGTLRPNGHGVWPFSCWSACKQSEPRLDAEAQCLSIVRTLQDKIPILLQIKQKYAVDFSLIIVPEIENGETPVLCFSQRIIDFCHATGTEIGIDLYA